jgi:hypothetical protein
VKVGIVGFGRSGTTLVANMIENFFSQENLTGNSVFADHWYIKRRAARSNNEILILCRRDLRDVLASGLRDMDTLGEDKFTIDKMQKPFPKNFKVYKEKYGVQEDELISFGRKHIEEGWYDWLPHVKYIFHYEAYMENKQLIAEELAELVGCNNVDINEAIEFTEEWKKNNPKHITDAKGKTNVWHDVFSEAQEKIIIDNFGHWMREYGYIK